MKNFASFATFTISSTEMMNIEGGNQVFGDSTVVLGDAPLVDERVTLGDAPKLLDTVQTFGGRPSNPAPNQRTIVAPKVKSVGFANPFAKGCFAKKH
jgi:hypothetical protein